MAQGRPTLDRKAAEQININVLKRLDPQVDEVGTRKYFFLMGPDFQNRGPCLKTFLP